MFQLITVYGDRDVEPIFGFMLFGALVIIVSVVARKRNVVGSRLLYLVGIIGAGFGLVVLISNITQGYGMIAGLVAFISPVLGLIIAFSAPTAEKITVIHGVSGDYKKCPLCAEAVRKEAVKCKYCGSDLPNNPA
ncbi:hypothetical protein EH228_09935 [Erwinia endophytica]|nr:hypothetical protein EH228_09935 [Erwinia endophytica]